MVHRLAAEVIEDHGEDILKRMQNGRRDKSLGTELVEPDIIFENEWIIKLGNEQIEARYLGPAHGPWRHRSVATTTRTRDYWRPRIS